MDSISKRILQLSPGGRDLLAKRVRAKLLALTCAHRQLIALNASGKYPPFFCVHPSGGDVLCYSRLASCLSRDQQVYGVRSQGLEEGEDTVTTIEAMSKNYIQHIVQFQPEDPYFLGGYSMGAVVAFEMARQLKAAGRKIALLALFDMWVITAIERVEIDDALILSGFVGSSLPISVEFLRDLPQEKQIGFVWKQARENGLLDQNVSLDQVRRIVHVCKANDLAVQAYKPRPYLGKVTLFRAKEERNPARGSRPQTQEPSMGWNRFAEDVEVHELSGNHDNLMMSPHVEELAARLKTCLEQARSPARIRRAGLSDGKTVG